MDDPLAYMARLCKSRAINGGEDNYHIFINSVEGISRICGLAHLDPNDCRIVCSQSEGSKDRNQKKLGIYSIASNPDPVKTFNFYTSTCFEGQDIFDKNGRTFIVSEPHKDHTKVDVMTSLLQICGRVRDSNYKTEINQFYAQSEYKDVSLEEFKKSIMSNLKEAEEAAELLDKINGERRERLIKSFVWNDPYISVENGRIIADRSLANLEIVNYGIVNGQYATQCNMKDSLTKAGLHVSQGMITPDPNIQLEDLTPIRKSPFKDVFEEYVAYRESEGYNLDCFRMSRIEVEKPLVKEAYEKLGANKVRELKYHQGNIKREIIKLEHETLDTKVFLMLDDRLPRQVAIPKSEIKEKLQSIYNELGLKQTAKATDLRQWYNFKDTSRRTNNGGIQACVSIISAKIKVSR